MKKQEDVDSFLKFHLFWGEYAFCELLWKEVEDNICVWVLHFTSNHTFTALTVPIFACYCFVVSLGKKAKQNQIINQFSWVLVSGRYAASLPRCSYFISFYFSQDTVTLTNCWLTINTMVCSSVRLSAHAFGLTIQQTNAMLVLHITYTFPLSLDEYFSAMDGELSANSLFPPSMALPSLLCWQQWQQSSVCWQDIMGLCGFLSWCDWQS